MDLMRIRNEERLCILNQLKEEYPIGTNVELVRMDDPYAKLLPGTKGKVKSVDDIGTIHVNWESGSSLGIVYGIDKLRKI